MEWQNAIAPGLSRGRPRPPGRELAVGAGRDALPEPYLANGMGGERPDEWASL